MPNLNDLRIDLSDWLWLNFTDSKISEEIL